MQIIPVVLIPADSQRREAIFSISTGWLQLDRGPLEAFVQQVGAEHVLSTRFRFNRKFHQRGTGPPGTRTFAGINRHSPPPTWGRGQGTRNHIVVFPREDEFQFVSQPGFGGISLTVTEQTIREVAEDLGRPDPLPNLSAGQAFLEPDPAVIGELRHLLATVHRLEQERRPSSVGPPIEPAMELDIITALVLALPVRGSPGSGSPGPLSKRRRALRTALEYINANAHEPPAIASICRASGASWRTLDYAFQEQFGLSPKQFLQVARLRSFHRDLVNAPTSTTVSEVAARWGFWHMGKLAATYRRQFGELPSETLQTRVQSGDCQP